MKKGGGRMGFGGNFRPILETFKKYYSSLPGSTLPTLALRPVFVGTD